MEKTEALQVFEQAFGAKPTHRFSAAGRINVIGEHVDYCGGQVFPAALNLRCNIYARKTEGHTIRILLKGIDGVIELDTNRLNDYRNLKYGNYQAGVAYHLQKEGTPIVGCDLYYDCTVPFGSGLSSSAAIEVSTAVALCELAGVAYDKVHLAVLSQRAENEYAGVNCGIMDQFASAMGKKNHAVLLNCATLDYEYVFACYLVQLHTSHALYNGRFCIVGHFQQLNYLCHGAHFVQVFQVWLLHFATLLAYHSYEFTRFLGFVHQFQR